MSDRGADAADPHGDQPLRRAGQPTSEAAAAAILVHGRGSTAESILALAEELDAPGIAYLAPQARAGTWYPHSFLAPIETNEPGLTSGLGRLSALVGQLADEGFPASRVALLGFSQGACLTLEFAARSPQRFGAIVGLTGGLIGPPGLARSYDVGSLEGAPVLLSSGDPDPHVPWSRVVETGETLSRLGAEVILRRWPGKPHSVDRREIAHARELLLDMVESAGRAQE